MERSSASTSATSATPAAPATSRMILRRLDRLEQRLDRIEHHVGLPSTPAGEPPSLMPAVAEGDADRLADPLIEPAPAAARLVDRRVPLQAALERAQITPPPLPVAPPPRATIDRVSDASIAAAKVAAPYAPVRPAPVDQPVAAAGQPSKPPTASFHAAAAAAPATPPAATLRYEPRPRAIELPAKQSAWEQLIGLKLAGWVGAIVLVIGAGLGIKYLYDIGFFTGVSPAVWLSLLSVCALGLIGAGEYVYRTINRISASGLFGAGIAGLFLISYAGHGYYGLYQRETAFGLMALSTLVGAGVAMRARLVSIGALSLIGGLLAPLVLQGDSNLVVPFLSYLLMLQVVALVLSWWGGTQRWWGLRGLSLAGTGVWTAAIVGLRPQPWGAAMWFTMLYAGLYHLELILSTAWPRRRGDTRDAGEADAADESSAGIAFGVLVTAALGGALLWMFADAAPAVRGTWMAALSAATLLGGIVLHRRAATRTLAYGYRIQSLLLLLVAVPVAFSGAAVCFGWMAVAIALAALGGKQKDRPTCYAAVAAWGLAVIKLIAFTQDPGTAGAAESAWLTLLGQPLAAWTIIAWALALAGHLVAWLVHDGAQRASESITLSAFASAVFVIACLIALPPVGATALILAYAWALVGADRLSGPRLALLPQSWALLALAAVKWAAVDTLAHRLAPGWSPAQYLPVLNPLMLTGVALAGSIVALYRLRRDVIERIAQVAPVGVLALVAGLITAGLTLEVDRAVGRIDSTAWPRFQVLQMAWTMLWTIALTSVLWLYAKLDPTARRRQTWCAGAWFIAGLLAIKFVLVDTLFWWWGGAKATPMAIVNTQTISALVLAGGLLIVHRLVGGGAGASAGAGAGEAAAAGDHERSALRVCFAAMLIVLWAGTLEIDRLVAGGLFPGLAVWPKWQLRQFAWSAWWTIGTVAFLVGSTWRDATAVRRLPLLRMLTAVPIVLAVKYLLLDTLFYRIVRGPAPALVGLNLQGFCGVLIFGALLLVRHLLNGADEKDAPASPRRRSAGAIAMIMLLWLGSLEIDRAFIHSPLVTSLFAQPRVAEQVALSIFWSAFAIGCVLAGFRLRIAGLRYFGLALFALTLLKVGVVDLHGAQRGYRILSFMGLGGLLLITSVLYGKLSPRLLREEAICPSPPALASSER